MQQRRDVTSNEQFLDTKAVDSRLITISIVEIVIVLGAGIYQFISLKNYLVSKQYI
jgi:predicted metal-binding membrane protein